MAPRLSLMMVAAALALLASQPAAAAALGPRKLLVTGSNKFIQSTVDKLPSYQTKPDLDLTTSSSLLQRQQQPARTVTAQLESSAAGRFATLGDSSSTTTGSAARRLQQQQQRPDLTVSGAAVQMHRHPARAVIGGVESSAMAHFVDRSAITSSTSSRGSAAKPAVSDISTAVKARFTDISDSNAQVSNKPLRRLQAAQESVAAKALVGSKRLGKGAPVHMVQQPSRHLLQQQQLPDLRVGSAVLLQAQPGRAVAGGVEAAAASRFDGRPQYSSGTAHGAALPAVGELNQAVKARYTDIKNGNSLAPWQ